MCKWIQRGKEKSAGDKADQGEEGILEAESNRRVIFSQCHKYCCGGFVGPTYAKADTGHNRSQRWLTGYWLAPETSPDLHSGDTPLHRHILLPLRQPQLTCQLGFCRGGFRTFWRLIRAPITVYVFSFSVLYRLSYTQKILRVEKVQFRRRGAPLSHRKHWNASSVVPPVNLKNVHNRLPLKPWFLAIMHFINSYIMQLCVLSECQINDQQL